ncbi:hypothetical protein BIW11_12208 [Tropilaelaps mercedesae]|uniref:EGF-like domain-containing protein n=1 Tax=Tropilaelaps mercedesae TaxID=418985 RepID=A0A1V9X8A0_9ACAR|nr:hypothetical protein BIW11_12208 [Tropilaelaps mercedesae]
MMGFRVVLLLLALAIGTGPVTGTGRCMRHQVDCLGFFTTCIRPSDICDKYTDCRSRIDEDFCECFTDHDCSAGRECVNQFPVLGKKCVEKLKCKDGMRIQGTSCIDVDECSEGNHTCAKDQFCVNTIGSFECRCSAPGMAFNKSTKQCDDIDECLQQSLCESPGVCTNSRGSYTCTCPEHFIRITKPAKGGYRCLEKDYCQNITCTPPLVCQNDANGGATCVCPDAAYEMRNGSCVDVDECQGPNLCQRVVGGAECINHDGWYSCNCSAALSTTGKTTRRANVDVNVCGWRSSSCVNTCGSQQQCVKGVCLCAPGYVFGNDSKTCEDVDECASGQNDCPEWLTCENKVGGFICVCPAGYRQTALRPVNVTSAYDADGCVDVDECAEGLHTCPFRCRNTPGSYECVCKAGYTSDASKRLCLPLGASSELLVSMSGGFYLAKMDFVTGQLEFERAPLRCDVRASAVFAFHQTQNQVYFVDEDRTSIYRVPLNDSCTRIVSAREEISALELDWIYGKVYWTDSEGVMVSELNGDYVKAVLGFDGLVTNTVVNPFNGWFLFVHEGHLWRVGLDGTHMSRLFEGLNVTSLAFDVEESNIAVQTDADLLLCPEDATDAGGCTRLDFGGNASLTLVDMFVDFAVLEDPAGALILVSRNGKHVLRLTEQNSTFRSLRGRVLHAMKQPAGGHKCHMQCSHLCVNSPSVIRYACLCPDNVKGGEGGACTTFISHKLQQVDPRVGSVSVVVLAIGVVLAMLGIACMLYGMFARYSASSRRPSESDVSPIIGETQLSALGDSYEGRMEQHLNKHPTSPYVIYSRENPMYRQPC